MGGWVEKLEHVNKRDNPLTEQSKSQLLKLLHDFTIPFPLV